MDDTYSKLPPGKWRAVLKLDPERAMMERLQRETDVSEVLDFDEVTEGDLPTNFEVTYSDKEHLYLEFKNAGGTLKLDDIIYKHDRATNKDTVIVYFPNRTSYLKVLFEDNVLEGKWYWNKNDATQSIDFVAHHSKDYRFTQLKKTPAADITGNWNIQMGRSDTTAQQGNVRFVQDKNHLTAVWQIESTVFKNLEGTIQENKFYLSCFDEIDVILIEGRILTDGRVEGFLRSGAEHLTSFSGVRGD